MGRSFTITTPATDVRADASGHAEAVFTVTNTTFRPIRGMAKVEPLGDTKREWLGLEGEAERDFAAGATHNFTVTFDAPLTADPKGGTPPADTKPVAGTTAGTGATASAVVRKYPFRMDVFSALKRGSDEDFTQGPPVTVEVAAAAAAATPAKKFPLWIILMILGVVVLVGGLVLFLVLRNGGSEPQENGTAQASPTPTPTPSPKPTGAFQGRWVNADPNTRGITRLQIQQNGAQLSVHAFGKCHPSDCDWGEEKGSVIGNSGNVTWDQGFSLVKMVITLQQNQLKVITDTVFNDSRPRMHQEYLFNKES